MLTFETYRFKATYYQGVETNRFRRWVFYMMRAKPGALPHHDTHREPHNHGGGDTLRDLLACLVHLPQTIRPVGEVRQSISEQGCE